MNLIIIESKILTHHSLQTQMIKIIAELKVKKHSSIESVLECFLTLTLSSAIILICDIHC